MEEENNRTNPKNPFSSSPKWLTRSGSLDGCISFETPISSTGDESETLKHKSVVVLEPPPSSDSTPCEIKLSFEQKHEIRQVYVRSTARIFEIYYTTEPHSSSEYLCTVRCGIAAKGDAALSTSDTEQAPSAHHEGSIDQNEPPEEKIKTDSSSNSDEDGWVKIKAPGSASLENRTCSLAKSMDKNTERSIQDFYEATAEITDSTPCISLTLRLLSLQTKGCVHIEEIYIFGEPVESTDSVDKVDVSTGSSMMAMLVPTLLQLSRTGMPRKAEDGHVSDVRHASNPESGVLVDTQVGCITREEAQPSLPNQKKADLEAASKGSPESAPTQSDKPDPATSQAPEYANHINDSFSSRIERTLDQLVHRVVRLESFCLRFEENMLKPISNIETRLERLEWQLEVLTTRSHSTGLFPCTRITAPDFSDLSFSESETNSLQNNEDKKNHFGSNDASTSSEFVKPPDTYSHKSGSNSLPSDRNDHVPETSSNNGAPDSVVDPPKVPGMIITAPEFSCEEDNDDGHIAEMSSTVNNRPLSIDDALAMALADLMTSTSAHPPQNSGPWIVALQDENDGDSGSDSSVSPPGRSFRVNADSSEHYETQNSINFESTSSNFSQDDEAHTVRPPSVGSTEAGIRDRTDASCGDESVTQPIIRSSGCFEVGVNNNSTENSNYGFATLKTPQTNVVQGINFFGDSSTEAVIRGCIFQDEVSQGTDVSCYNESFNRTITQNNQMTEVVNNYSVKDSTDGLVPLKMNYFGEDVTANPENTKDEVETILNGNFNSRVDFEHPVLDVKFSSNRNMNSRSPLETLLGNASETKVNVSCSQVNNGSEACTGNNQETEGVGAESLLVDIDNGTPSTVSETQIQDFSFDGENMERASLDAATVKSVIVHSV